MTPPDSGERKTEREMCTCGSRGVHHKPTCAVVAWLREQGKPDSGEREVPQHHVPPPTQVVSLPLSLAQRILAALELQPLSLGSLAAELRERLPKLPKEPK